MARMDVTGFDDLEKMFLREEEIATEAVPKMLEAGAAILVKAQKKEAQARGVVDTGAMMNSIKASKVTRKDAQAVIIVRPTGKDAKGIRNAEKAFVNEYGKGGQIARPFISAANIQSEAAVHDAMTEVWRGAGNG